MDLPSLILASASPRRQELLTSAGISFQVVPGEVDEGILEGESPENHVLRLARRKALKATGQYPGRWVLAADTVVVIDGKILGKPADRRDAREMLELLSGREHRVITGYCILRSSPGESREATATTRVRFKKLLPAEMEWYLETGEPFDKAGAYAIQGQAAFMVRGIRGSYTNVVGLPLCEVIEDLEKLGAITPFPSGSAITGPAASGKVGR